jgi:general secretion pathway protein K
MPARFLIDTFRKRLPRYPAGDSGFALVSAVWISGLLAVMATAFVIVVRSHILAGNNIISNSKVELVANGVAIATAFGLADPASAGQKIAANGERTRCAWSSDISIDISVQDQGGLIDLNTASPELLTVLFRGLGASEAKAGELLNSIRDFRDPDSLSENGGEEPRTYPGKSYGPKNGPFAETAEVDQIPGFEDALFQETMRFVTVHSQQSGIDLAAAPPALLDALTSKIGSPEQLNRFSSPSPAKVYSINVVAQAKNNARFHRQVMAAILKQPKRPFAILEWERGGALEEINELTAAVFPCFSR